MPRLSRATDIESGTAYIFRIAWEYIYSTRAKFKGLYTQAHGQLVYSYMGCRISCALLIRPVLVSPEPELCVCVFFFLLSFCGVASVYVCARGGGGRSGGGCALAAAAVSKPRSAR